MSERSAVDFPAGFRWGAATSAHQNEGAVRDGDRDHHHLMDDDIALMAELGLQGYRFSISWSRVMPDGRGRTNRAGLDFYHRLVERLLGHGIEPFPTLFHSDLPSGLETIGGFRNRDTCLWFADYAALMVQELGDRVTQWATLDEPWCFAYLGHVAGVNAPGFRDPRAAVTVAHHQLLAHGTAVDAMRAERTGLALGIVLNPSNVEREGTPSASADQIRRIDGLRNRWWLDGLLTGTYPADLLDDLGPLADAVQPGDLDVVARTLDWLGINYYSDILVRGIRPGETARPLGAYPTVTGTTEAPRRSVHTDMGWPITPDGFTRLLVRLRDEYPGLPPIVITENGCSYDDPVIGGRCDDRRRIEYLDLHLRALKDAIDEGVDVRGYFHRSLMDSFEWAYGFDQRFGLVHVDVGTLERTWRDSATWYRDVIARNGLAARIS